MKVRLIKTDRDKYHIETEDFDGLHLACYPHDITKQRLSLKNCQAIEQGYDLDELITSRIEDNFIEAKKNRVNVIKDIIFEILGDKKFSEDDMKAAIQFGLDGMYGYKQGKEGHTEIQKNKYILSLQQTEWDVNVEMECPQCQEWGYVSECINNCNKMFLQPKFDKDKCLMLKKNEQRKNKKCGGHNIFRRIINWFKK